ncbi:Protein CBG10242 [Caenorhabditis briggsae]|uniref:Protein CBG10242 n=1 Tax=Caenorhabditis briggsae TaxID=6238 RepID=A8XAS2_CAEBR|nr:Protein CBG10242 [Caenorhabditis briggsae]CAP29737.2 Protein CBG10242 [Caenorhabditis briggsae]
MLRRNSSAPPVTRRPSMNSDSSSTTIIKFPFLGKVEIRKTAMVTPLSPSRTSNLERTASRSVKYQVAPPERKRAQSVSRLTTTEKTATPVTTPKQIHGSLNNLKDENLYKYYPDPPQKDHYMKVKELGYCKNKLVRFFLMQNTQCPDWVLVQKTIPVGLVSTRLKDGVHVVDEFRLHMKLSELQHPNILKMFSMKTMEFFHELRMEYVDGGSLKDQLCKNAFFTEPHAREIFTQLIDAVAFLHRRNIAHFDIHPGNIFVTQTGIVKVGGFWRAQMCFDKFGKIPQTYDGVRGHKAYAAPECYRKRKTARYLAPPVDNWACGIVLLTMLTNNLPWLKAENAKNPSSAIRRVASNPNWKQ